MTTTNGWLGSELNEQFVYFVHSFYVPITSYTSAITEYTLPFSSAMNKDNFYAVQFHPEKSALAGVNVIKSFLNKS
jgi:glutamine amidotransferase